MQTQKKKSYEKVSSHLRVQLPNLQVLGVLELNRRGKKHKRSSRYRSNRNEDNDGDDSGSDNDDNDSGSDNDDFPPSKSAVNEGTEPEFEVWGFGILRQDNDHKEAQNFLISSRKR
ncbi:uncharacterized protein LOC132057292 isoform X2 [Lycium ferocissimum]|uniref:uncharacterized protein LOC132057292 isoform X2 n=1 Tax=Lycium ferocissimum TaxID=112874 RepID=UPI002814B96A|nr:uncharacterized protein LOC132057292 isoform X2 [Lycium ferocissimum]